MAGTGMAPTDTAPFTLRRATGTLAESAAKLAGDIGATSVEALLAQANRTAVRRGASATMGGMKPRPADWYAFDVKDQATPDWYPQGVTCGEESGAFGAPVFLVTWYFKPDAGERGIRVSFLSPQTLRYRHALLVQATPDGSYAPIDIHAGGVACHGHLLYVADTVRGLRVFDLANLLDLRTVQNDLGDPARAGRADGRFHAFGYRYVIPQTDFWRVAQPGARFSFVSVDRSGPAPMLVTGEYLEDDPGGRVARWPLGLEGGAPADAYVLGQPKVQGALSWGGRWYMSQAADAATNGRLLVHDGGRVAARPYPIGPEDLTVQDGRLWSVTEFRNKRVVFGVAL